MGKTVTKQVLDRQAETCAGVTVMPQHPQWLRLALRAAGSLILMAVFLWLLAARLEQVDLTSLWRSLHEVSGLHWAGAALMTVLSFCAVGHYDAVLHRHFGTGLPDGLARRAGICAIAVSQTLGLGMISGAFMRWRMLPGQSLWLSARLTTAVAVSFLAGWAVVTCGVLLVLPDTPFKPEAAMGLLVAAVAACFCLIAPRGKINWPNGMTLARLLVLTAVDTLAAAAAFYLLCPDSLQLAFLALLPAFLLAFGAGLVSGTPGGLGAFEITLLALLPTFPEAQMLAAVLAWRLIYYAVPAVLAAAIAIWGARPAALGQTHRLMEPGASRRGTGGGQAELGLIAQRQHRLLARQDSRGDQMVWLCGNTPHCLVGLFDPVQARRRSTLVAALQTLRSAAHAQSRVAVLYKVSARAAAGARARGMRALRIAQEACLDPGTYTLALPARAGLRRKLRHAIAAGLEISGPAQNTAPPWRHLDAIAADWATAHQRERGFSMGRYSRSYVQGQRLYIAWHAGEPAAFVTFHATPTEWALDLMRHRADLPDGCMHLLVHHALQDAKAARIAKLSLAAVPDLPLWHSRGKGGLLRFKSAFAPRWQPLYLVAPNICALAVACAEIARAIHWPAPLPDTSPPQTLADLPAIEQDHADYEFASAPLAWQRHNPVSHDEVADGRAFKTAFHP